MEEAELNSMCFVTGIIDIYLVYF